MVLLVNLNSFALNSNIILFDDKDLNNSKHISLPFSAFDSVADLAAQSNVEKVILQGAEVYCTEYKRRLETKFMSTYSDKKIKVVIDK